MNQENQSALLEFKAENVMSFEDILYLTTVPQVREESEILRRIPKIQAKPGNEADQKFHEVLPVLSILGANASGKSNVLKALYHMRILVIYSFTTIPTQNLERHPFKGNPETKTSSYQVELIQDGTRYTYGFELSDDAVEEEWAYWYPKGIKSRIFERVGQVVRPGSKYSKETNQIARAFLRPNALFLTTCAQFNHPGVAGLYRWFNENLDFVVPNPVVNQNQISPNMLDDSFSHGQLENLMQAADFGIERIEVQPENPLLRDQVIKMIKAATTSGLIPEGNLDDEQISKNLSTGPQIKFVHKFKNASRTLEGFEESTGTMSWWRLLGWILNSLNKGTALLIDELDSSLHPLLVLEAVNLFQNPETNPKMAQLIFNGHSVAILDSSRSLFPLRRDQIYLVDKDKFGSSSIFPLSDVARLKDEAILKRYLMGIYGGIPHFDLFDSLVKVQRIQSLQDPEESSS